MKTKYKFHLFPGCVGQPYHVLNPGLYPSLVAFAINSICMDNIIELKNHTFFDTAVDVNAENGFTSFR